MRAETLARDQHPVSETRRGAGASATREPTRRRFWRDRTVRRWLVAWVGALSSRSLTGRFASSRTRIR